MVFKSLQQAEAELAKYIPAVKQITGKDITLERMGPFMASIGNPQDELKVIHIAGTSGKTSTTYYIASLLEQTGKKVGHTVSPHIDKVTERVQVNLMPISDSEFCDNLGEFMELVKKSPVEPTYFELMIGFVYWYFHKIKVDYAVMETGLGGTQDATNVVSRKDKINVITDIGLDHTNILGNTILEITSQKAGIIQPYNEVFSFYQNQEVSQVLTTAAQKKNAKLHILKFDDFKHRFLPKFQRRNWLLAKHVYDFVAERDGLPRLSNDQITASQQVTVPARMETFTVNSKTVILDGSHNKQKMANFVESIQEKFGGQASAAIVSFSSAEGYRLNDGIKELAKLKPYIIITTFNTIADIPKKSVPPYEVQQITNQLKLSSEIEPDPAAALKKLLQRPEELLIITGSFYLLASLRRSIIKASGKQS